VNRSHSTTNDKADLCRPRQRRGGGEDLERRRLPAGVRVVERAAPAEPELVVGVPRAIPDRVRVSEQEVPVGALAAAGVELVQEADEDALELGPVAVAAVGGELAPTSSPIET